MNHYSTTSFSSKGDALQVNLVTNRAALAVGTAALSSEDMYMAGGRGKNYSLLV